MDHAGWRSRGYIPHCNAADIIQHITISTIGAESGVEANFGLGLLAHAETAAIGQGAILHFDDERYRLLAWCVMSNHVHAVVQQIEGWPLANVVHSWKSFTANRINRALGRTGPVWLREYFDRYMRDDDHLAATIFYVEHNPVEAGIVDQAVQWPWSSAGRR